jgi:hypothetical protein
MCLTRQIMDLDNLIIGMVVTTSIFGTETDLFVIAIISHFLLQVQIFSNHQSKMY